MNKMAIAKNSNPVIFWRWIKDSDVEVDSPGWMTWLSQHNTFRYDDTKGGYLAKRDKRGYWSAYRKWNQKLRREYLGKDEALTLDKLQEVRCKIMMPDKIYWFAKPKKSCLPLPIKSTGYTKQ